MSVLFLNAPFVSSSAVMPSAFSAGSATVGDRMFDHFGRAGQIQTALIMGDLDGARRPGSWLAEHESFEDLGSDARPWVELIRSAAREVWPS